MTDKPIEIKCQMWNCYWHICKDGCASRKVLITENQSDNVTCLDFITKAEADRRLNLCLNNHQ